MVPTRATRAVRTTHRACLSSTAPSCQHATFTLTFVFTNTHTTHPRYVSGGAGSVGATVGMLSKRRAPGITVIGSAGSQSKLDYMKSIGYDAVFNYKEETVAAGACR
jgi:NADPH-dependent curcumin reductase CurA